MTPYTPLPLGSDLSAMFHYHWLGRRDSPGLGPWWRNSSEGRNLEAGVCGESSDCLFFWIVLYCFEINTPASTYLCVISLFGIVSLLA